jgi:hypothetical protein
MDFVQDWRKKYSIVPSGFILMVYAASSLCVSLLYSYFPQKFFPLRSFYLFFPALFFPFVLSAILSELLFGQIEEYSGKC